MPRLKPPIFEEDFLTDDLIQALEKRVRNLEERTSKLEKLVYTNPSKCCCKFDDDSETIIQLCLAHKLYFEGLK